MKTRIFNQTIKKLIVAACGIFLLFGLSARVSAQTTAELQAQIQALINQVAELQAQLAAQTAVPPVFSEISFSRDLAYGSKGEDVVRLQELLIAQGYLAPGFATGNFYTLTYEALKRYQVANGIPATGYFGPITRAKANADLAVDEGVPSPLPSPLLPQTPIVVAPEASNEPIVVEPGYVILPKPRYDISDLEKKIQDHVNAERSKNGLNPLVWSPALADTARLHSQDQAGDNGVITAASKPCSYPYIRHEGFVFGFHLGDRLKSRGILYAVAGENIAAFSVGKNFLYRYPSTQAPIVCPAQIPATPPVDGESQAEAKARVAADIRRLVDLITPIPDVQWVQKQWLTPDEIADEITAGWMNSPGHRRNVLDARFVQGGMGVVMVNDYVIATHLLMKGY